MKRGALFLFFWRTVRDVPAGAVVEQFLDGGDAYPVLMNHVSQTLDPGYVIHGVVTPLPFTLGKNQILTLIYP